MFPIEEIRQLAGGSGPPPGLMDKIRGSVALDTRQRNTIRRYSGMNRHYHSTLIGQDTDLVDS